jgi:putative DNA primase/helicase
MSTPITPDLVRNALSFIPANLPRDDWARIGMAIKSEYPDETGLQLFSDWSAGSAGGFDAGAVSSTWRSIKGGGGVGVSTLIYQAQQHGFKLPPKGQEAQPVDQAEIKRRDAERKRQQEKEAAQIAAAQAAASVEAQALWDSASDQGESPYLARKGVRGHGVRFTSDGWLLVPVRDGAGRLWNVQRIAPGKPQSGTDKFFIKDGRKSGLWHVLGSLEGASQALIAEGYATAASLRQATGLPVVAAFDAGNLLHVAKALRQAYPKLALVVCGDDDVATAERTGHNPGREKAEAAARAVGGVVVFPADMPLDASDFNDMHLAQGLEAVNTCVRYGLDGQAVGACLSQAVQALHVRQARDGSAAGDGGSQAGGGAKQSNGNGGGRGRGKGAAKPGDDAPRDDPFTVDDDGVWYHGRDRDGNPARPLWLCSPLHVDAQTRNHDDEDWGSLLVFSDPSGKRKQWAMPARMLSGDGGEYRATLLGKGLRIAPGPTARNRLTEYIQNRRVQEQARCTDRIGWHGTAFVLPHETIGDDAERIVFQSDNQMENTFRVKRDAQAWAERIGALCVGNSRMVFAVSCALAGPLLRPAGMESGGFHLRGDSSSGKTTALRLAASVYGGPSYMQRWRTTDNALEAIAAQHCDSLLILDELAQVEGKVAGECAYMLANEQSKARATRGGAARARLSWRLLFLSAGELGLADHMAEGGKRARTGQEVRMADIPADAGAGMGAFENLHGYGGGAAFSAALAREAALCYGAVGHAFLQWLTRDALVIRDRVRKMQSTLAAKWVPASASGQVSRVAARFALVGAAGELATEAGLTGWPVGESEQGAKRCFDAWLAARGGAGNGEVTAMLRQARSFFESHGEGRFTWWHRATDDHSVKTLQRAGFRRLVGADGKPVKIQKTGALYSPGTSAADKAAYEDLTAIDAEETQVDYFVLPEVFRVELCRGFDHKAMCKVLLAHGCLKPGKDREYDAKHRLPGMGPAWCYHVTPAIMELDV